MLLRLLAIGAGAFGAASIGISVPGLKWPHVLVISGVVWVTFTLWLKMFRKRRQAVWSDPFSWTKPFWPMERYPARYWLVASEGMIAGGAYSLLIEVIHGANRFAPGALFVLMGTVIVLAVITVIRSDFPAPGDK